MRLKKISSALSFALILSSMSVIAYADNGINTRAIIGNSVVIDKGNSSGNTILPPGEVLNNENIGTWGDKDNAGSSKDDVTPINKGSIKITLSDTGKGNSKGGVKFSLSKVANIVNGKYELLENYSSSGVDLNNLKSSNDLDIAANLLKEFATPSRTMVTEENGVASISDLDVGVYLISAEDIAGYDNITPFIVSIPVWNDADNTMSFDVEVIPKHTPIPEESPHENGAPPTGYDGSGSVFGVLSCLSLACGTGVLTLKSKKEE